MPDIRLKPKIRTTIAVPSLGVRPQGAHFPKPEKDRADGGAIVWRTLEHPFHEKEREWFFSISILAGALAVASLILGNALFGILIVVSTAALFLHVSRVPTPIICEVNKNGIFLEKMRYRFEDLEHFWIDEKKEIPLLHLKTTKALSPHLHVPLRREDVQKIRGFVGKRMKEAEFPEPLAYKIAEALGL
ncbi:MAG: hypothetical protein A3G11_01455 [Candidatus Lloydbacteria bacterium RIFCSPLOWO2_12_FULL_51_9]|uniref:DUF5673 domain-containing protein n=2 Tax=Candidatus Lloydiibacteriota TaxID=1817910 RepID=A0A1G2DTL8_9BACT|nr:MAG: hypothetical protein A3J08_03915 [Candidatus Lloydbacteria bacterium RIFCSPLOWO2_02_FULL_51_11]OGZ16886.1 MAG: hypothetical protein A3G11_01455 [Candidatus Lloydbacteria bacterium RIFCSPLOWO2_12_FULL_51_9]